MQKFICLKIRKKAFLGNSASKAHLKHRDAFALLNTYPKQMENKTMKVFAKYSAVFLWQVSGSSGMPVKLVTFIYKYMYIFIEQLEVGARVYRKVLTNVRGTDPHIQLFPLTNSCSLQTPNLGWSSPQKPEGKKKATADWAAPRRQAELSTPWGQGFTSHPGCWPCKTLTS